MSAAKSPFKEVFEKMNSPKYSHHADAGVIVKPRHPVDRRAKIECLRKSDRHYYSKESVGSTSLRQILIAVHVVSLYRV
jgi:hypothetical protein